MQPNIAAYIDPVRRLVAPLGLLLALVLCLPGLAGSASALPGVEASDTGNGSAQGTDPYWPLDGNGGTDAQHYDVRDRKSTRLNSSHVSESRMPSSA